MNLICLSFPLLFGSTLLCISFTFSRQTPYMWQLLSILGPASGSFSTQQIQKIPSHWTNSRYMSISAQPICQRWVYQSGLFQLQVIGNLNSNSLGLGHLSIPTNQWQMSSMQQGREKQANVYINGPAYGLSLQLLPEAMAMQWGLVGGNVAEMGS